MPFRNIVTFSLLPKVSVYFSGNEIVLAYLNEGKIAARIIQDGETIEKTTYSELQLSGPNDKLLAETNSMMVQWYNGYYICYGYQEIRDISKGRQDSRLVFFCNKVLFER